MLLITKLSLKMTSSYLSIDELNFMLQGNAIPVTQSSKEKLHREQPTIEKLNMYESQLAKSKVLVTSHNTLVTPTKPYLFLFFG